MKKTMRALITNDFRVLQVLMASIWPPAPKKLQPIKIVSPTYLIERDRSLNA